MIFGSVCSGIESASVAWEPLGWRAAWFSEIEPFPCSVLKARFPDIPNLGDMTKLYEKELFNERSIDLLVGGTPCQGFSVAGLRGGLADPRSNLALHFLKILASKRPRWVVWENVPGVLSSWTDEAGNFTPDLERKEGGPRERGWQSNDFDTFTFGLRELGYGLAWRILDAQHLGVPQRRRRVFVVGYLGDWRPAAAVLFESHGLSWNPPPSREAGEGVAPCLANRAKGGGGLGTDAEIGGAVIPYRPSGFADLKEGVGTLTKNSGGDLSGNGGSTLLVSGTLAASGPAGQGNELDFIVTHSLKADGFDASEDGIGRGTPIIPIQGVQSVREKKQNGIGIGESGDEMFTLTSRDRHAIAFGSKDSGADALEDVSPTLRAGEFDGSHANGGVPPAVAFMAGQGAKAGSVAASKVTAPKRRSGDSGTNRTPCVVQNKEVMYNTLKQGGIRHGDAKKERPAEALRILQKAVGEEAFAEWGVGIVASFWPTEVLQSKVHGGSVRCAPEPKRGLVNVALSRSQVGATWSVLDLWEAGCAGCPPQGWKPSEQLAEELGAYLSRLPYSPSPTERFMLDLRITGEGSRLLREALSAIQEARRSQGLQEKPAHAYQTRRLTVEECEALQGFPRGFTLVDHRGKPAADGPRYKSLGNSMAIPPMRWIGQRIQMVEDVLKVVSRR